MTTTQPSLAAPLLLVLALLIGGIAYFSSSSEMIIESNRTTTSSMFRGAGAGAETLTTTAAAAAATTVTTRALQDVFYAENRYYASDEACETLLGGFSSDDLLGLEFLFNLEMGKYTGSIGHTTMANLSEKELIELRKLAKEAIQEARTGLKAAEKTIGNGRKKAINEAKKIVKDATANLRKILSQEKDNGYRNRAKRKNRNQNQPQGQVNRQSMIYYYFTIEDLKKT